MRANSPSYSAVGFFFQMLDAANCLFNINIGVFFFVEKLIHEHVVQRSPESRFFNYLTNGGTAAVKFRNASNSGIDKFAATQVVCNQTVLIVHGDFVWGYS